MVDRSNRQENVFQEIVITSLGFEGLRGNREIKQEQDVFVRKRNGFYIALFEVTFAFTAMHACYNNFLQVA